jgi:hypothetical protein
VHAVVRTVAGDGKPQVLLGCPIAAAVEVIGDRSRAGQMISLNPR